MSPSEMNLWVSLSGKLTESFGVPFDVWDPAGEIPSSLSPHALSGDLKMDESSALAILTRGRPIVRTSSSGDCWLMLPIPLASRRRILALARIPGVPAPWIERMAEMFLEAHRQMARCRDLDEQMNAALSQITSDFEQQTFLRFLAEQIEICEVNRSIEGVIRAVLPRLQRVVSARLLMFVPRAALDEGIESSGWMIFGKASVDRHDCLAVIRRFQEELQEGPVVRNRGFSAGPEDLPPATLNLMAIEVKKDSLSLGWILAFDRAIGFVAENEIDSGFGTTEAGLLEVTGFMLATHGRNIELFQETEALTVDVVRTLVSAIEARDSYTRGHSERVALLGRRLARAFGLPEDECERIYVAGLLHDIGKIGVPDEILRKPGQLTKEEFAEIQRHPEIGVAILEKLRKMAYLLPGVLSHHERIDGAGYPQGLEGDTIPLQARILAVVDSWDAMTSARPYRDAMSKQRAAEILAQGRGKQWDEAIIDSFLGALSDMIEISNNHQAAAIATPIIRQEITNLAAVPATGREALVVGG